ncbi:CHY zinc finger protein [Halobacillus litoralis]|uniref:CHY zinc finger protein n=1 Tax=Halobacillus litoralis TaxID=45668 RepID=UPI0021E542E9|nr:CHY zinc finger protein [Halobacillus litoralis]
MRNPIEVYGVDVDQESRCTHYHSQVDIVALKFRCCRKFYACYQCHQETTDHPPEKWPLDERDHHAILCGHCRKTMSIDEYMNVNECPHCQHAFNAGCKNHYPLYFDME